MKREILYITSEMLPGYGLPVGGGGIRAWSLGKGLESRGHSVHFSLPQELVKRISNPSEALLKYTHDPDHVTEAIRQHRPEIAIFQQWPPASSLEETDVPIAIDLHGSLLIENSYRNLGDFQTNALNKLKTLSKADYFTCAGNRQKWYWWAWLMLSGMDPKELSIGTIPVSLAPELPEHQFPEEPAFVFGGVSWAWQDPTMALNTVVDKITKANKGILKVYSGKHPFHSIPGEKYNDLQKQISSNERVKFSGMISREELIQDYTHSTVAIDVMARNTERELAFTTRTIEYLWCGLPVIYGDYLELSSYIKDYSAGWIIDPSDQEGLQKAIDDVLNKPELVKEYSRNARRLVRENFTWDKTIEPLDQFCQNPVKRKKSPHILQQTSQRIQELENEKQYQLSKVEQLQQELNQTQRDLQSTKHDLDAIRSKTMFKAFKAFKKIFGLE